MARGYTTRKLEVYALHGRTQRGALDYAAFFGSLARMQGGSRTRVLDERIVALPILTVAGGLVRFIAYEGAQGENPLIFNTMSARERFQRLRSGEIVATKTHGAIDLATREAIVEYNHRGAKASDIAELLEDLGRQQTRYRTLSIELNPVVDESFLEAIDRFEQVRLARLRVVRPNVDWTDHFNRLSELGAESDARTIEVEVTAQRKGSLRKSGGIITLLKEMATQRLSSVRSARVTGIREGESSPTSVSLTNYVEHQRVTVRLGDGGHVDDEDVEAKIAEFLDERRPESATDDRDGT